MSIRDSSALGFQATLAACCCVQHMTHFSGNLVNGLRTEARIVAEPFEECNEHAWFKTGPAASLHREQEASYFCLGPSSLVP